MNSLGNYQPAPIVVNTIKKAESLKFELDTRFKQLAKAISNLSSGRQNMNIPSVDFQSRIKTPETVIKKVAHHRLKGKKNYDLNGVNDVYGGRFIVKTPQQKLKIIQAIHNLDKLGTIKILKEQQVDKDTYHAYHIDISYKGIRGEIQIHDPHSFLEAVVNHDIRAKAGENPPPNLQKEKKLNARVARKMPMASAQLLGHAIEQQRKNQ